VCIDSTHYEVLGVGPDASADQIRRAYRDRARRHHPDRAGATTDGNTSDGNTSDGNDGVMSRVNEAYRVLNDAGRRAVYDRSLAGRTAEVGAADRADVDDHDDLDVRGSVPRRSPLAPSGPARLPWKLMLVTALVGSALVLVAAAFTDPPSEEPPDGILRSGSCVEIEPNGDAREIACTGDDDIIVELLLPTGAVCPQGMVAHRDRLGLGTACIAV
jgi:molecular chaperone DnaJ